MWSRLTVVRQSGVTHFDGSGRVGCVPSVSSTFSVRSNGKCSIDSSVRLALSGSACMASGFRLTYATTVPFGRHFGVFEKFEIIIANRSLVLMSATPFAVRTLCRCWIAAFGSRYTRPAAVDTPGTAIWDIGGIVEFCVSRTVWACLMSNSTFKVCTEWTQW